MCKHCGETWWWNFSNNSGSVLGLSFMCNGGIFLGWNLINNSFWKKRNVDCNSYQNLHKTAMILQYTLWFIYICYLTAPGPTLGRCQEDNFKTRSSVINLPYFNSFYRLILGQTICIFIVQGSFDFIKPFQLVQITKIKIEKWFTYFIK